MSLITRASAIAVAAALSAGCATIMTGTTQEVTLVTQPPGAKVVEAGIEKYTTPVTLTLSKVLKPTYIFKLDGHQDTSLTPEKEVNPWLFGNILIGGIIGLIVDAAAQNGSQFTQDTYLVTLPPLTAEQLAAAGPATSVGLSAFIAEFYDPLMAQIDSGSGELLAALYTRLGVSPGREFVALPRVRKVAPHAVSAADLATLLSAEFRLTTIPMPPTAPSHTFYQVPSNQVPAREEVNQATVRRR